MEPLMLEMISGGEADDTIKVEVARYIDESTGIQTIHQMKWLSEAARRYGKTEAKDPWEYKAEYNRRLMLPVNERLSAIETGQSAKTDYMIAGSRELLNALKLRGVKLYAASGTDHPDVVRESKALGLYPYFDENPRCAFGGRRLLQGGRTQSAGGGCRLIRRSRGGDRRRQGGDRIGKSHRRGAHWASPATRKRAAASTSRR